MTGLMKRRGDYSIMLGTIISILGISLTGLGTFVRVAPDLERRTRRHFYSIAPITRDLFLCRKEIKKSATTTQFTIRHRPVRKELIDYIDAHHLSEPPDQLPKTVTNVAADIEIELPSGETNRYPAGELGNRTLVKLLTLSIERRCRNSGLMIGAIGVVITIFGTTI